MGKILGIIGSPRKQGNTDILVNTVLAGAQDAGAETRTVYLGDITIEECSGCHVCWEKQVCSKSDGMTELYPAIIAADAIVFGTPVYWYGPTALMKGFMDRFVFFNCVETRNRIRGKHAAVIVPFEEDDPQTPVLTLQWFEKSLRFLQMDLAASLAVSGVSAKGDVRKKKEELARAFAVGQRLAGSKG